MMNHMHWYAETPIRRAKEVSADLLVVAWVVMWVAIAGFVHDLVSALSKPAGPMRIAGDSLQARMLDVADKVGGVPLVGEDLQGPFAGTASVGGNLTAAADELQSSVDSAALWLSVLTAGTPIVLVLGAYLWWRIHAIRAVSSVAAYRDRPELQSLLALRALTRRSTRELSAITADPLGKWRDGDPDVIAALASMELRDAGLRPASALPNSLGSAVPGSQH